MTRVLIDGICKSYRADQPVLRPIQLTVEAGELFFLLGPSGCGKSTLLRILAGLLRADDGRICFNDTDVTALPPEKRQAAMVFQSYALWPHLNVFENVAFGLRTAGASAAVIREEVTKALELVRLADCADRKIPSLSGGQQQRVALARALAVRPKLLLLDEPLSNLDARLRDTMRLEIRRITKERNLTAIYVTHDRREALSMADRLAVLSGGVLQQTGTPEEVYRKPANRFVASFLGDGNFLEGTVAAVQDSHVIMQTALGDLRCGIFEKDLKIGEKRDLLIRPEALIFDAAPDATNRVDAVVEDGVFLGDHREWKLRCGNVLLEGSESSAPSRIVGSSVSLAIRPELIAVLGGE
ncbi:MAG: ABC transporter ATP-binding protein [Lentisphaeria bacterium]|nr:ABC transporter ATP-binding protein [Lentisphaeria bacterium]